MRMTQSAIFYELPRNRIDLAKLPEAEAVIQPLADDGLEIPDKIRGHACGVGVFEGQVFAGGGGQHRARGIAQLGLGLEQPAPAVGGQFGGGGYGFGGADGPQVTDI